MGHTAINRERWQKWIGSRLLSVLQNLSFLWGIYLLMETFDIYLVHVLLTKGQTLPLFDMVSWRRCMQLFPANNYWWRWLRHSKNCCVCYGEKNLLLLLLSFGRLIMLLWHLNFSSINMGLPCATTTIAWSLSFALTLGFTNFVEFTIQYFHLYPAVIKAIETFKCDSSLRS